MSEQPRGALPQIITFVVSALIGIWFGVPSDVDIGVKILQAFAVAIAPLNDARANQMVSNDIIYLRVFGWLLFIASIIGIYLSVRRRE